MVRDLRVHAQVHDAEVYHYRDNTGLAVDAIVETAAGAWMGVEIKLGGEGPVEEGVRNLLKLRDRVDPDRTGPPAALAVITGVGHGYTRPRRGGAGPNHRPRSLSGRAGSVSRPLPPVGISNRTGLGPHENCASDAIRMDGGGSPAGLSTLPGTTARSGVNRRGQSR